MPSITAATVSRSPLLGALPWLLAAILLLRVLLSATSGASLYVDEAQYWDWSRSLAWGYYSKPPVIAALIRLSTILFGDGEMGVRLLPMLCWPLTAAVLASLGAAFARAGAHQAGAPQPHDVGLWAALLLLSSPLVSLLGLVATTDAPLLLCWALALRALWAALAERRGAAWLLFAVACGVGLLDKYTMAALLPGAVVWVLRHGSRRDLLRCAAALLLALAIFAPNLWWNAQAGWPTLRHTAEITVATPAVSTNLQQALEGLLSYAFGQLLAFGAIVLPGLAWAAWRRRGTPAPSLPAMAAGLLFWTSLPLLLAGLVQAARGHAEINWIAPVHLALALALAWVAPRLIRRRSIAMLLLGAQLLLMAALCTAPMLLQASQPRLAAALDPWRRMRGWQQAFDELEPWVRADPPPLLVGTNRAMLAQAAYHWRDLGLKRAAWVEHPRPSHHYELMCPWHPGLGAGAGVLVLAEDSVSDEVQSAFGGLEPLAAVPVRRLGYSQTTLRLLRAPHPPTAAGAAARNDTDRTCR